MTLSAVGAVGLTIAAIINDRMRRNYPFFIRNEELPGKYKHIGVEYHCTLSPNEIRFKLYYPSSAIDSKTYKTVYPKPKRYFTNVESIEGLYGFTRGNPLHPPNNSFVHVLFSNIIKYFYICMNAPQKIKKRPLQCNENTPFIGFNTDCKHPLMIFSHGLGASFDIYTQICIAYASFGFIVAIFDHNDGSAMYTQLSNGKKLYYHHPYLMKNCINNTIGEKYLPNKENKWDRNDCQAFWGRSNKFGQRIKEFKKMYYYLKDYNYKNGNSVINWIDGNHIWGIGHSYGAITAGIAVKELLNEHEKDISGLKGVIMYDPWCEIPTDELLSKEYNLPSMITYSQEWAECKSDDFKKLAAVLHDSNKINEARKPFLLYKGFTHQDYCDIPDWAPAKYIQNMGYRSKIHSRKSSIQLLTKSTIKFIGENDPQLIENGILTADCLEYQTQFVQPISLLET